MVIDAEDTYMKEVKLTVILKLPEDAPIQPWPEKVKVKPDYAAAIWSLLRDMQRQDKQPEDQSVES